MDLLMISPEIFGDLVMDKYLGYNFDAFVERHERSC